MSETPSTAPSIEDARKIGAEGGPTVEAERLAFEAWMEGHCWSLAHVRWDGTGYRDPCEENGMVYAYAVQIRRMWAAWRDRAALAADALTAERAARERAEAKRDALAEALEKVVAEVWAIVGPYGNAPPGSYARGFEVGVETAGKTARAVADAALAALERGEGKDGSER